MDKFFRSIIRGRIFLILAIVSLSSLVGHKIYKKRILQRDLLITGCARSGTAYISHLLQACQMQIGHEKTQKDGVSSWIMCMNSKRVPWGVDSRRRLHFSHIFHQVRHPLKVIPSLLTEDQPSWRYVLAHIPEIHKEDPPLVKCAKYWYYWNLKAQSLAEWTYQIEQIDQVWDEFCHRLERKLDRSKLELLPHNVNTRSHQEITWEDLRTQLDPELFQSIQMLAQQYGYSLKD